MDIIAYKNASIRSLLTDIEMLKNENELLEKKLAIAIKSLRQIGNRDVECWGELYEHICAQALSDIIEIDND